MIAGLGNVAGALYAAFMLGLLEAFIQFSVAVRFAFPAMLLVLGEMPWAEEVHSFGKNWVAGPAEISQQPGRKCEGGAEGE